MYWSKVKVDKNINTQIKWRYSQIILNSQVILKYLLYYTTRNNLKLRPPICRTSQSQSGLIYSGSMIQKT